MAKGLRQLKIIVSVAGAKPILSTISVGNADDLAQLDTATASLLPGPDGSPAMLVVQLSQSSEPQESPSPSSAPPSSSNDPLASDDYDMANVNITGLPVDILVDGSEWLPSQRIGQTAQRISTGQLIQAGQSGSVQAANTFFLGPVSGAADTPTFRLAKALDIGRGSAGTSGYLLGTDGDNQSWQGFLQAGTGAVTRTWQAKDRDTISSADFNVVPDAGTDQTTVLQAAITASAGKQLKIIAGTYLATGLTGVSNIDIVSDGSGEVIIKRPNGSLTTDAIITFSSKNNFSVTGITFDGNKANQTVRAHNVVISACYQYAIVGNKSINAKLLSGGFGAGIVIVNTADAANSTTSRVAGNSCYANDASGIFINIAQNLLVSGNGCVGNTGDGITLTDTTVPASPTNLNIVIDSNICTFNGSAGIAADGYTAETANPTARNVIISNNVCDSNTLYGIVWQSIYGTIVGNTVRNNGNGGSNGGILFNAQYSTLADNIISENSYFGIDAGGCLGCAITGNVIRNNGGLALGSNGISAGGCQDTLIEGNGVVLNPAATGGGAGIVIYGIDGGGAFPAFLLTGTRMVVRGNKVLCANTNQQGISVARLNPLGFSCSDNYVSGTSANASYIYATDSLQTSPTNAAYVSSSFAISVSSAATLVIPDEGSLFTISGTTGIDSIRSYSLDAFYQKVRYVTVTGGGTGYTNGDAVTFTGGGGSGATGTAYVVGGVIRQVNITNSGSGYATTPTPVFGGSGSGATGTAVTGCLNITGRIVRLVFSGALIVNNGGGNVNLVGAYTTEANNELTLLGTATGTWREISRGSSNISVSGTLSVNNGQVVTNAFGQMMIRDQFGAAFPSSLYVETGADSLDGFIVRGHSGTQTGHLQKWQNSSGYSLNKIDATGIVYFGTAEANTLSGITKYLGKTSGTVTVQVQDAAGTYNFNLPTTAGTSSYVLTSAGGGSSPMTWTNPTSLGIDLDVGSTAITNGTTTRILYDNAGVLGEYALTGSGTMSVLWTGSVSSALSSLTGATDGFRGSAANVTQFAAENTTASSATQGGFVGMYSNDGAAMASGDRLGGIRAGGSSSASALRNSALIGAFADQLWVDASAYGSRWEVQTTTNGSTSATTKWVFGNAGLLSFGATAANTVPALKPSSASLQVRLGDDSAFADLSPASVTLNGSSSGTLLIKAPAAAGSNTLTFPAGTTDFSGTGGTSQVVKQTSSGGAFTVAQLASGDISGLGTAATQNTGTSGATIPLLNAANTWGADQTRSAAGNAKWLITASGGGSTATFEGTNSTNTRTAIVGCIDGFNCGFDSVGGGDLLLKAAGTTIIKMVAGGGAQIGAAAAGDPGAGALATQNGLVVGTTLRINQTPSAIGTGAKTISNAADSSTNFGHYLSLNMNGTTYYIPCGAAAPT